MYLHIVTFTYNYAPVSMYAVYLIALMCVIGCTVVFNYRWGISEKPYNTLRTCYKMVTNECTVHMILRSHQQDSHNFVSGKNYQGIRSIGIPSPHSSRDNYFTFNILDKYEIHNSVLNIHHNIACTQYLYMCKL